MHVLSLLASSSTSLLEVLLPSVPTPNSQHCSLYVVYPFFVHIVCALPSELFEKTGIKPSQIGILVVNCSLFVPTPSWCAHVMNHFKMGGNVLSFNLGGMGCSGKCVQHGTSSSRQAAHRLPLCPDVAMSTEAHQTTAMLFALSLFIRHAASPIAIDLARRMLMQVPNTYALVLSTENITQNMYKGVQRSMLIPNVLFRVGGAAMLLTNKRSEAG